MDTAKLKKPGILAEFQAFLPSAVPAPLLLTEMRDLLRENAR